MMIWQSSVFFSLALSLTVLLQGCGSGGSPSPSPSPGPPSPSPSPTPPVPPPPPSPELPIKGICYAPFPCNSPHTCPPIGHTSDDMAQAGYKSQWGSSGRDDLGIMRRMGANFIRLYHPIGVEMGAQPDHTEFLDAAKASGLNIFGAVHQYLPCDNDDCYDSWNAAIVEGFKKGFSAKGAWHPSVWAINMINEVDAIVPPGADSHVKQVKRLISAVDGLLAAEKSEGVSGSVNMTSCWTTALATPLGGGKNTIYHGFSSMENWMKNPSLVDYKPRSMASAQDLAKEIDRRWIHCLNAQMPWKNGLDSMVAKQYAQFLPRPWIVGEMGWNGQHQGSIESEMNAMQDWAKQGNGFFGTFVFQFQTAYQKGGAELNFGLFGLGQKDLGQKTSVGTYNFSVRCLTSRLWAFEQPSSGCKDECNHRAQAVTKAFGGSLSGDGLCLNDAPLGPTEATTKATKEITV